MRTKTESHSVKIGEGKFVAGFLVRGESSGVRLGLVWPLHTGEWAWDTEQGNHGTRATLRAALEVLADAYRLRATEVQEVRPWRSETTPEGRARYEAAVAARMAWKPEAPRQARPTPPPAAVAAVQAIDWSNHAPLDATGVAQSFRTR